MSEVELECRLARNYSLENIPNALAYLLIKVIPDPALDFGSMPMNLGLVIDASRSMGGKKIKYAREAAKLLVNALRPQDSVSVTIFSDDAEVIVPATNANQVGSIMHALDKMHVISGTRMYHGMETGVREMQKAGFDNAINRMIILTDGMTEGEERCCSIAEQEADNRVVISTFGIGDKYNEDLLMDIAGKTLGSFQHLQAPESIISQFQQELRDSSASVISDMRLSIHLTKDVELEQIHRIFPDCVKLKPVVESDGRVISVAVGNVRKDEQTCFGAQFRLPARSASRVQIAQVYVNYNVPGLQIHDRVMKANVIVEFTADNDLCGIVDREVVAYFNQINAQSLIEKAMKETKAGNIAAATQMLNQAQLLTQRIGNAQLTRIIDHAAQEIKNTGGISSEAMKTVRASSSQTVRIENVGNT